MSNPLGTAKDVYKLRQEAKKMQDEMKNVMSTGESKKGLVKITLNGIPEIVDINIDDELLSDKSVLKDHIKQAMSDAQKRLQKEMAKGMDMGKLKGMLGM